MKATSLLQLAALSLAPAALADRTFMINNACPGDVTLFISADSQGIISQGASITKTFPSNFTGFIYSSSNGASGTGRNATMAGFFLQDGYYYLVKDASHFNMGVEIVPHVQASSGFCGVALCEFSNCTTAFTPEPTSFPPPTGSPPSPPLFECDGANTGFSVTFCPSGQFPPSSDDSVQIRPISNVNKCLDVRGDVLANGTPVQIYDCNGTGAQNWLINAGSTKVQLAGTNFCLDAGSSPANGVGMKIWECFDNLPAQQWFLTADNRIALQDQGFCLDLTNGVLTNGNEVQIWQCTDNDNNQAWTL